MSSQTRAILWAQWRSLLNYYPKANKNGIALGAVMAAGWYGMWLSFAVLVGILFSDPANVTLLATVVPGALLFVFIYWQVMPLLLGSSGVSLSTRKLQVYPIPNSQMFFIELLLRISTSFEMVLILSGLAVGLIANPRLPKWSALGIVPFAVFNLCLSAGMREVMLRLFARKRVREITVLFTVMLGVLPQLLIATGGDKRLGLIFKAPGRFIWPWTATASIAAGHPSVWTVLALCAWTAAAYVFGRWQFGRTLSFDADEINAASSPGADRLNRRFHALLGWPSLLFRDPLAALIEKEIRFLSRSPRFRLVFVMGFTFGLVVWLPVAFGKNGLNGTFGKNYLTLISVYALLLLGDVCFWNTFGFDRMAAQAYWAMPVRFSVVLAGKNISSLFWVLLETTCIIAVCAIVRMPITAATLAEAYCVTLVVSGYLISLGNLTSTANARPLNPAKAMRTGTPGRFQALLLLLYPVAATPVLLAYGARYAFQSEAALFIVLAIMGLIAAVVYSVSLDSAVAAAERNKERLIAALAQGEGIMQA
jgi:ABC-2 type transport system permease protein